MVTIRIICLYGPSGVINKINLATEHGMEPDPAAGPVEWIAVVDHTMVGDGDGFLSHLLDPGQIPIGIKNTIGIGTEEMTMKVGEHGKKLEVR